MKTNATVVLNKKVRILVANSTGAQGSTKQVAVTPVKAAVQWEGCQCWVTA
ncbi:MAG: hypothetical protein V4631_08375 [Pseudomonadota bacterium]